MKTPTLLPCEAQALSPPSGFSPHPLSTSCDGVRFLEPIFSRFDLYLGFDEVEGGEDESKAEFACPLCTEELDIVGLCYYMDEEHPVEAKNGVSIAARDVQDKLSFKRDKSHILFGGTKILQHTPDKSFYLKTPDGGCLAVILWTGFQTSQGKLMRTILFSTERVTANSWESGLFTLFLVFFAIIAAGYVLKKGLEDPTMSKYKLFLSCSLIITSVIPPELPMELSIAVNTSLIALARRGIFCTEPFRIPFAGKVDICCFDKTGTLTSDDMEFREVVGLGDDGNLEAYSAILHERTVEVLASCHALVFVENKLVGDPLKKAALKGIDWIYTSDEKTMPKRCSRGY